MAARQVKEALEVLVVVSLFAVLGSLLGALALVALAPGARPPRRRLASGSRGPAPAPRRTPPRGARRPSRGHRSSSASGRLIARVIALAEAM